ncbi:hypothetical protein SCLCIDRAFT_1174641, partial [Scleroderma citrinum Foug A]
MSFQLRPQSCCKLMTEQVFSSSKATCTLRRNRISSQPLKALQILKFTLRKDRLDFTGELLARE